MIVSHKTMTNTRLAGFFLDINTTENGSQRDLRTLNMYAHQPHADACSVPCAPCPAFKEG